MGSKAKKAQIEHQAVIPDEPEWSRKREGEPHPYWALRDETSEEYKRGHAASQAFDARRDEWARSVGFADYDAWRRAKWHEEKARRAAERAAGTYRPLHWSELPND